jgi:YbgC/YbaW family acyl-CoA thioester hydrolase
MFTCLLTYQHIVKLHDTDSYGIIFFPNQLRICHDALQELWRCLGHPLRPTRSDMTFLPVVVHAESDYLAPIRLGDELTISIGLAAIGTTSITLDYRLRNQHDAEVGRARTVQVCIDPTTSVKIPVPPLLRAALAARHENQVAR